jgi:hypothetical protein
VDAIHTKICSPDAKEKRIMKRCHACEKSFKSKKGGTPEVSHCGADLHVCLNCLFFSPADYNQCREPQAERVVEKSRSNFCDYFTLAGGAIRGREASKKDDPRSRLDALFKK